MSAQKRYYVPSKGRAHPHVKAARIFDVIDRQTKKSVWNSIMRSDALRQCRKLNICEASYAGGFNKRYT